MTPSESKKGPLKDSTKPAGRRKWPHFTRRYGKTVRDAGVVLVPRVLLTGVARLKLKPTAALVLLQLIACWGTAHPHPFPGRKRLRNWLGVDKRTLDRAIGELVELGLVEKHRRTSDTKRQTTNEYQLSGLVEKLQPLAERVINERRERVREQKRRERAREKENG
jgi:DNA-binding MarR family transcriptional regulator